jgi:hypothetical protein
MAKESFRNDEVSGSDEEAAVEAAQRLGYTQEELELLAELRIALDHDFGDVDFSLHVASPEPDLSDFPALENMTEDEAKERLSRMRPLLNYCNKKGKMVSNRIQNLQIDDNVVILLCRAITQYPECTFRTLDLSNTGIGNRGAQAIAVLLTRYFGLESVILDNNCIAEEGARALEKGLRSTSWLRELSLTNQYAHAPVTAATQALINTNLEYNRKYVSAFGVVQAVCKETLPVATNGLFAAVPNLPPEIWEKIITDRLKIAWNKKNQELPYVQKVLEGYARDIWSEWTQQKRGIKETRREYLRERLTDALDLESPKPQKGWQGRLEEEANKPRRLSLTI